MQIQDLHKTYRFITTADGSPTIEIGYSSGANEAMHNSQGAFEESIFIYGQVLDEGMKNLTTAKVLSLGLGLGYNEFLTASYSLNHPACLPALELSSFEQESFLKENFLNYLNGEALDEDFKTAYNWILKACEKYFNLEGDQIIQRLLDLKASGRWHLEKAFDPFDLKTEASWSIFLYDAFSSKISPHLWSEEALTHLLSHHSTASAYFSTYAATGALKRSLKACGFELIPRSGFSGKRQSTYACRL